MGLTSLQVCMDMDSASDQHHHWLQTTMHEDPLMDSSSSPSAGDMLGPIMMSERRLRPPQDQALKCPRCDSTHTKFCYYNNYSLSQPRYFCKTCRRYWTKGGTLRNIPVGGGFRKNRKSSSSSKKLPSSEQQLQTQPLSVSTINSQMNPNPNPNPMMMMMCLPNPVDLQLSFQTDPFSQLPSMIASGSGYSESMLFNNIASLENNSIRPMDFCLDHKGEAVVMNTSKNNNSNHGYFSSHFGGGGGQYVMSNNHHDNLGYAQDLGLSYIDNNSAAQLDYPRLHEHIPMDREVKPNKKMLALEWQQEEACSDARNSRESFGYLGSWSGMSSAGNYHHQQQQLLPSSTTNNSLV